LTFNYFIFLFASYKQFVGSIDDKNINTLHFPYRPSTLVSPRLRLGMIPGLIWRRSCVNLYVYLV